MQRIATSIVLIVGQLTMLCAAPLYLCTSADGSQRIEWGDCGCDESHHGGPHENSLAEEGLAHEHELAEPPCHCEHRPLTEGTQLVSRRALDSRGVQLVFFADAQVLQAGAAYVLPTYLTDATPRGHTALSDRLSICLRC